MWSLLGTARLLLLGYLILWVRLYGEREIAAAAGLWMQRRWRGGRGAEDQASAPVLAAARGVPLSQLLQSGRPCASWQQRRRIVLGCGFQGDRRGESGTGCVAEKVPGPIPEQWKRLDVSTPFLRAALESTDPLQVEFISGETATYLGPLIGMHSAVWIPLRERGRTFGLAMVGYARPPGQLDLNALRARADEITLAVQHHRNARRNELAAEELRAQLRLSRAILCGVSVDSILPQIARAARHYVQAEFIALGRGSAPPFAREGWDGVAGHLAILHQESLLQLWRNVFQEGRECEIPGEALANLSGGSTEFPRSVLDRVVAIPIEVRSGTRGVLMAGLLRSEDSSEDFARLESYALLAASALDREVAREERTASNETLRRIIEDSSECLIVIDGEGKILETSRAAALLLFSPWGRVNGTLLEELFSTVARDAVIEWRDRLQSLAPPAALKKEEVDPVALEAALVRGGVVRMQLRREITGMGGNEPRWLIQIDDQEAQQTLRESEERLEAEMAGLLDSIESGVLLLDADGRILMASDRLAAIFGFESRRLMDFRTIDTLIDSLTYHFIRPAETAARWRDHVRQGDEASWDEIRAHPPVAKNRGAVCQAHLQARRHAAGLARSLPRHYRAAADPVQAPADGKNGRARPTCLRDRPRTQQSTDKHPRLCAAPTDQAVRLGPRGRRAADLAGSRARRTHCKEPAAFLERDQAGAARRASERR